MIFYHHIGGRNGTYPLPLKKGPLLSDFHLILYDADENCFEQMKEANHADWGKVSVFPYCIGGETGVQPFHLNFHPTTNSLYQFNPDFKDYNLIVNAMYGEYSFGDACQFVRAIDMNLLSLEDALEKEKLSHIDFLSLDVQGAEYDILSKATHLLQEKCIGIQLEVEFVKLYQDQKIFADINQLMDSMGFELLDLDSFGRCAPMSLPIGFRGLEQPLYAEAVYIKKLNTLLNSTDVDLLYKSALFCLMYKKVGMCLKILKHIAGIVKPTALPENISYINFLNEIWRLFEAAQHIALPKLSHLFSNEKFQNYYGLKKSGDTPNETLNKTMEKMKALLPTVQQYNLADSLPFEELLKKYCLEQTADIVKEKRLFEVSCFLDLAK